MKKRIFALLLALAMITAAVACTAQQEPVQTATQNSEAVANEQQEAPDTEAAEPTAETANEGDASDIRVALIVNQRLGDQSSVDMIASGLYAAAEDYGFEYKTLESISTSAHEDDVRAMAREGYDLVITTFPGMSEATLAVANEFPETKFAAIYQYINANGVEAENVWSTEYHGEEYFFAMGALGAKLSKTGKIAYVGGEESPSANSSVNAVMAGALYVNPDAEVQFSYANNWEDPALGKEIALTLASNGVDYIVADAAKTSLGLIEGAKEAGILVSADTDFAYSVELYPDGYFASTGLGFAQNAYMACEMVINDNFTGGIMQKVGLREDIYFIMHDKIEAFQAGDSPWAARFQEIDAASYIKEIEGKIKNGEITVEDNTEYPDFAKHKN